MLLSFATHLSIFNSSMTFTQASVFDSFIFSVSQVIFRIFRMLLVLFIYL